MLTQRKKRLKRLNNEVGSLMLRSYDKARRKITRLALPGFAALVLQYPDKQFSEDFRMPRERFEVNDIDICTTVNINLSMLYTGSFSNACSYA